MEKKKIDIEVKLGGICGGIAILAIIAEMILNGMTAGAIVGGIKDIASTMVAVWVFVIAIKQFMKNKPKKSFEDRMNYALDKWCEDNSNMIVRSDKIDGKMYGIGLKTHVEDFYKQVSTTKNAGRFVQMPLIKQTNYENGNIELLFSLNKGTFFEGRTESDAELLPEYEKLNSLFSELINTKFSGFAEAGGKGKEIKVVVKQAIYTDEDIEKYISLINTMYLAYLVSANLQ